MRAIVTMSVGCKIHNEIGAEKGSMIDDGKWNRLREMMKHVYEDVASLVFGDHIFRLSMEAIRKSGRSPSTPYMWLMAMYPRRKHWNTASVG